MAELKALGSHVIVKLPDEEQSHGIYLIDKDFRREILKKKDKRSIGGKNYDLHMRNAEVVSVGPRVKELQVKDKTRVNIHNGQRFEWKGEDYLSIEEVDTELVIVNI